MYLIVFIDIFVSILFTFIEAKSAVLLGQLP